MTVRTRIAPSPTGDPHVGTAYIALFNYCFAKQHGGQFILRVEDTDQERSTQESEQMILDALRWTGLTWDEGPDVGGPHGPYRQSERSALYAEHAQILLDKGHAFRCFCTPEELDERRKIQMKAGKSTQYDGRCLSLTSDAVAQRLAAGEPHVVRMKIPTEGVCIIPDMLRGTIEKEWSLIDMQVLLKSDGLPTYHLANVVDDHYMEITHVMRGEEWINSAPKHLLLYQYFGWEAPTLCHMPLLRNPDKSKLSKRNNPTSIIYYQRLGVLPKALLNYLGRMGWSMPNEQEKFNLDAMIAAFDINRMSLGGPIFDIDKLSWLNGQWIRDLSPDDFADAVHRWALNRAYLTQIAPLVQERIKVFGDLGAMTSFFFSGLIDLDRDVLLGKDDPETLIKTLQWTLWHLETLRTWDADTLNPAMRAMADLLGLRFKMFVRPFFVALTGSSVATPLFETMEVLGADISRARIRAAVNLLAGGPLGKKKQKKWRKAFDHAWATAQANAEANPS